MRDAFRSITADDLYAALALAGFVAALYLVAGVWSL